MYIFTKSPAEAIKYFTCLTDLLPSQFISRTSFIFYSFRDIKNVLFLFLITTYLLTYISWK